MGRQRTLWLEGAAAFGRRAVVCKPRLHRPGWTALRAARVRLLDSHTADGSIWSSSVV